MNEWRDLSRLQRELKRAGRKQLASRKLYVLAKKKKEKRKEERVKENEGTSRQTKDRQRTGSE